MKKSTSKGGLKTESNNNNNIRRKIQWELRPGGMLVQKRDDGEVSSGPVIKIKVSHGSYHHEITVPAQSTFGDLKRVLASETGLEPKEQRLLFQGKEKDDDEWLHMVGVMDMSKVMLFEDPASKERKLEEMKRNQGILNAYESVARVRAEVDKLSEKVVAMETIVHGGKKVADKEFVVLTELLMRQLLNLDAIEADGEARVHRRIEVRRVQSFVETLDKMKARNSNPFGNASNSVSVTTKWETFETRFGSPSAAVPQVPGTKITQDWELFDSPSFHPIDGPVNIQKGSI